MMEGTTPLPVFPTTLIRGRTLTDHPKLIHYPTREWVWRDGEEVVICRPLCGSKEESQIAGNKQVNKYPRGMRFRASSKEF